jgi:hypothetical protein
MKIFVILFILFTVYAPVNAQVKNDTIKCICCRVEIDASFPGGETNWKIYLADSFRVADIRCLMPIRDTSYTETAIVLFVISKDGSITNARCMNSKMISAFLKDEAERLIMASRKWIPAQQNGRVVNGYRRQEISITISPLYL